ncbi:sensor histidine kinase [Trueperella pecoris]|uniref:histidine kinase n=1 Tax=Trueperella pecoris TaxID=2733571 RepID=A0A7M1R3K1_9ACTO|nr:sensor histidine kinase [Trueperella pecoris]QOR48264.1 sensor histidine kinase [Trueperella pecoris]
MKDFATIKGFSPADLALALFVALLVLALPTEALGVNLYQDALLYVASVSIVIGTFLRRTHALPAAIVVYIAALLRYIALPHGILTQDVAVLFALYAVLMYGPKAAKIPAIAGASFGAFLIVLPAFRANMPVTLLVLTIFAAQAMVFGTAAGALLRRHRLARMDTMLADIQLAQKHAERDAELAVVGERTRIAREMHDIVAHTLSVVIAQADGGRYAAKSNPEAAERALNVIADMSRAALADIRSIIGVLRDADDLDAPLAPEPVDTDLISLTDQVRESGHQVSYVVTGQPRPLPVGVGNALYRICQEALTNALKHAGPEAQLTVSIYWRPSEVVLDVSDNGRGAAAINDGKGHGIIGMNERAAVFGGTVVAGPRPGGGFKVTATIPTPGERKTHV